MPVRGGAVPPRRTGKPIDERQVRPAANGYWSLSFSRRRARADQRAPGSARSSVRLCSHIAGRRPPVRDDQPLAEMGEIAASTAPLLDRAEAVLETLSRCLPSDGAWLALSDPQSNV